MRFLRTILATLHKEWLVLIRDWAALLTLLVMPAMLVIIMALVQDAPFRDYQTMRFDLLMADEDQSAFSNEIKQGIAQNPGFRLLDSIEGKPVSAQFLNKALQNGDQQIGVIIPKGCGAELANTTNMIANGLARTMGLPSLPERLPRDSVSIHLYFDPVSKPTFRMAIHTMLDRQIAAASSRLLITRLSKLSGSGSDSLESQLQRLGSGIGVHEYALGDNKATVRINSVQHNVPAWAIFGMFFIVVPVSGQIVRERDQGSMLRIRLIPGAERGIGIGRILFYALIACLQFLAMCAVGRWLLPTMNLPALTFGLHPFMLAPVVIATGLCATAYGYCLGMCFRSGIQALSFGAISIVILSALGGIWIPVELLPQSLQNLAQVSPLHWSLSGVQAVMLRDLGWNGVWMPTTILCLLAMILWGVGLMFRAKDGKGN